MGRALHELDQKIQIDHVARSLIRVEYDKTCLDTATQSGYEQAMSFLKSAGPIAAFPMMWLGGRERGLQKVGRTMCYNAFDFVQTLGTRRNGLVDAILQGKLIEMRAATGRYEYMEPDLFDLVAMQALLEGAHSACQDRTNGRLSTQARIRLERLLAGNGFRKETKGEFLQSHAIGKPREEDLIGAVLLLHTKLGGKSRILVMEETLTKPQFDKYPGDMSLPAESRKPFEPIPGLIRRLLQEELGWKSDTTNTLAISRTPIGYYRFRAGGSGTPRPWIVAMEARVDPYIVWTQPATALDNETRNYIWVDPEDFLVHYPTRGAMVGIVNDWMNGMIDTVDRASPGRHDSVVIFDHSGDGITGSVRFVPRSNV